jgi:hypothetical protein
MKLISHSINLCIQKHHVPLFCVEHNKTVPFLVYERYKHRSHRYASIEYTLSPFISFNDLIPETPCVFMVSNLNIHDKSPNKKPAPFKGAGFSELLKLLEAELAGTDYVSYYRI